MGAVLTGGSAARHLALGARHSALGSSLLALITACGAPSPRPLGFGTESCTQCHMTLADPRFGAELVLRTGKVLPFDDPGCLATYVTTQEVLADRIASLWVSDFLPPHELIAAREAVFLLSDAIRSPMDHRIAAFRSRTVADSVKGALGGRPVRWEEVLALVQGAQEEPGERIARGVAR